jgi:uncharacterized membrane-anchored protein YitT (DUF2179 family)
MRFEEKLAAALGLLASTGILRSSYAPPFYRLLWKLGAKAPPPHFQSFTANFVRAGILFGVLMSFILWSQSHQGTSPYAIFAVALFAGVFSGLGMAAYYRYGARKHRIPLWRDFHPADDAPI